MSPRSRPADDWPKVAHDIRVRRATDQCECRGECSQKVCVGGRCPNHHLVRSVGHRAAVAFLTVVPLDGDRSNHAGDNLRAYCQWCQG